jgi:hypothetical protein
MTARTNDRVTDRRPEWSARYRDHDNAQNAISAGYYSPIARQRTERMAELAAFRQTVKDIVGAGIIAAGGWLIVHLLFSF